jgi:hypothetical protein
MDYGCVCACRTACVLLPLLLRGVLVARGGSLRGPATIERAFSTHHITQHATTV